MTDPAPDHGCFFTQSGDIFLPTDHTRGPWNEAQCHAGPPTGLLARAVEALVPGKRLTRLTVTLDSPIPFAGFKVHSTIVRNGRTVANTQAWIEALDGRRCANANALHIQPQAERQVQSHCAAMGAFEHTVPGRFPFNRVLHDKPAFNGAGIELRYPPDESGPPGPTRVWMKTVPLLPDEAPSPFQKLCPLADCGNALSRNADIEDTLFMNPDLTIVLHRDPVGDWFGSDSQSYWESNGMGMSDAQLFDTVGSVGRAVQSLLLLPNPG